MYAYLADTFQFQPTRHVAASSVFAWLRRKLGTHRERQTAKRHNEYLRTLDRHILSDMDVDIASLDMTTGISLHSIPMGSQ
ncbi:MAG: hypothetical protein ACREDX_10945 [Aestuariivirga sp.]